MAARSLALALRLLLLLQDIQSAPQVSLPSPQPCGTRENWFYDATAQSCCFQCPSGSVQKKGCPQDPAKDCLSCGQGQFVNMEQQKPRCDACVSCTAEPDLVEKQPCSFNASSECECRAGLFCQTSVTHTCSRCQRHTECQPGFGVRLPGTATSDVTCEECPAGTFSGHSSSTDTCQPHTDCAKLNKVALSKGNATHDQVCLDQLPTYLTQSTLPTRFSNETGPSDLRRLEESLVPVAGGHLFSATTAENPSSTPEDKAVTGTLPTSAKGKMTMGGVLPWALALCGMVVLGVLLFLWKWKVCKRRILILKGKRERFCCTSHPTCALCLHWQKILLTTESGPEEKELMDRVLPLEPNNNVVSSPARAPSPQRGGAEGTPSGGNGPDCPGDPRVRDHTNNRIEKLYIMKADTVIVGSVSEVPGGKNCPARGCDGNADAQEVMGEELPMHYPEQETESFPGSDVMVPVEEEGKEFHHPTTATEK
ncbi:TNR8 factor, partial [Sakesphorus luctuosus]|nr:TNR8 factor [Sakesphorus luctuosus]